MEPFELREILLQDSFSSTIINQCNNRGTTKFNDWENALRNETLGGTIDFHNEKGFKYLMTISLLSLFKNSWDNHIVEKLGSALSNKDEFKSLFNSFFKPNHTAEITDIYQELLISGEFWIKMDTRKKSIINNPKTKWKSGDIFRFKREDGIYIFGKVLIVIKDFLKGKKRSQNSGLIPFTESYLVDIYDQFDSTPQLVSETIGLRGVYSEYSAPEDGYWEKIGEKEIKLTDIDFPELIYYNQNEERYYFLKGQLSWLLNENDVENLTFEHSSDRMLDLDSYDLDSYMLFATGKKDHINPFQKQYDLSKFDFRYKPVKEREELFKIISENPNASYYELAEKHKINLKNYLK
jgi:hypothetical protein